MAKLHPAHRIFGIKIEVPEPGACNSGHECGSTNNDCKGELKKLHPVRNLMEHHASSARLGCIWLQAQFAFSSRRLCDEPACGRF
jgi:hypothetical protein